MSDSGGDIRPYREPCNGVTLCGIGPIWQHGTHTAGAEVFTNSTTVDNPAGGDPIPPYERWTPDPGGATSCDIHFCVTGTGAAPCSEWPKPFPGQTFISTGTNVSFDVCHKQGFKNVQGRRSWHGLFGWISTDVACPDHICSNGTTTYRGYQEAPDQTKYLTITVAANYDVNWDDTDGATQYSYTSAANGARTVNANSGEITSTIGTSEDDSNQPDSFMGSVTQTLHVVNGAGWRLEDSGVVTYASGLSTMIDEVVSTDVHCNHVTIPDDGFFGNVDLPTAIANWNAGAFGGTNPFPVISDLNNYDTTIAFTIAEPDGSTRSISYRIMWSRTSTVYSWDVDYSSSFSGTPSGNPETQTAHFYGSLTLSDPNTAGTIYSDITNNLLVLWPLNDDALYPWRTDLKLSLAPLVTRNEIAGSVSPLGWNPYTVDDLENPINDGSGNTPFSPGWTPTYDQRAWFDPAIYQWTFAPGTDQTNSAATGLVKLFDGSILGAPLPAGYQNYFNFGFIDERGCCYRPPDDPGFQTWSDYQVGWGQYVSTFNSNSGCHLPLNATQWNNWAEGANKPAGAWIIYADKADYFGSGCASSSPDAHAQAFDAGQIVACKYAEILEIWNSQNFGRPAGDDKFIFDENFVFCATNAAGSGHDSTWNLIDPITGAAPTSIDLTAIWGGPVVGGFYTVSDYTAGVVTLNAKVWDVPSNWASKSNADDSQCFGKLRFPTYPSLLGRVVITPDVAGTTFTFATPQPAFGMDASTHQEQVDLWDAAMSVIASNVTATRVDDSTFTTVAAHSTAKWVTIHGAPAWYFNDTRPKGDYAVLKWWSDFRTSGEYNRLTGVLDCDGVQVAQPTANRGGGAVTNLFRDFAQTDDCLPFTRKCPRVVCISPNGETFPNGATYAFPETYEADEQYGSKWWGYVQQTMTDLFWQPPHRPCNIEACALWGMDGGTCVADLVFDPPAYCCPGDDGYIEGESLPPKYFYRFTPLVEARVTLPPNYGMGQDESAPALPTDVQLGWSSPVTHANGDGNVAFPPTPPGPEEDTGVPGGATLAWDVHTRLCFYNPGCRFDYATPAC